MEGATHTTDTNYQPTDTHAAVLKLPTRRHNPQLETAENMGPLPAAKMFLPKIRSAGGPAEACQQSHRSRALQQEPLKTIILKPPALITRTGSRREKTKSNMKADNLYDQLESILSKYAYGTLDAEEAIDLIREVCGA